MSPVFEDRVTAPLKRTDIFITFTARKPMLVTEEQAEYIYERMMNNQPAWLHSKKGPIINTSDITNFLSPREFTDRLS